jgi:uncharacterized protein (TIGR02118 family)
VAELNTAVALYGQPTDPAAFDDYYLTIHVPHAQAIPGVQEVVLGSGLVTPEGAPIEYYRLSMLRFATQEDLMASLQSAEGQAAFADIPNFATGGATAFLMHMETVPGAASGATPAATPGT